LLAQRKAAARMNGELPAGHPPIGGASTQASAPANPTANLAVQWARQRPAAATRPATHGALTVRAVQGTAGGPAVGELPVVVELLQNNQLIDKFDAKTAADGTLRVDTIPLDLVVTPVVKVTYHGVEYTGAGGVIDAAHAEQQVQVPVFETTEQAPAWTVKMQHVMLEPTVSGMRVTDMLAIENPSDRAWIGTPGKTSKRRTLSFALPAGAKDVQLGGGLHDCCTVVEDGKIVDSMALVPGVSQYRISYTLPVSGGNAELAFATPAPVGHLMVFIPDDGSTVSALGVSDGGVASMGGGKTRFYKASDVAPGTLVKLNISGITARATAAALEGASPAARDAAAVNAGSSARVAKLVAGIGGLAIFVVGGMLLMFKAPKAKKA
jgi:hypothetical protein